MAWYSIMAPLADARCCRKIGRRYMACGRGRWNKCRRSSVPRMFDILYIGVVGRGGGEGRRAGGRGREEGEEAAVYSSNSFAARGIIGTCRYIFLHVYMK